MGRRVIGRYVQCFGVGPIPQLLVQLAYTLGHRFAAHDHLQVARIIQITQDLLVAPLLQRDLTQHTLGHWTDGWDGYMANRSRMLASIARHQLNNPVFWGGDIHSFWATDLHADANNPDSPVLATEFVGTSVTSDGPPYDAFTQMLPQNPHVKFFDSRQRGYVSVTLDAQRMLTHFRVITDPRDPAATVSTLKSFVVEPGRAGAIAV